LKRYERISIICNRLVLRSAFRILYQNMVKYQKMRNVIKKAEGRINNQMIVLAWNQLKEYKTEKRVEEETINSEDKTLIDKDINKLFDYENNFNELSEEEIQQSYKSQTSKI